MTRLTPQEMAEALIRTRSSAERLVLILRQDDELAARDAEIEIPRIQAEVRAALRAELVAAVEHMPTARIISQWDLVSRKAVLEILTEPKP